MLKLLAIPLVMLLVSCGEQKTETYTADYLKTHDDVRAKVLADCKENKQTPENCTTANAVETKKRIWK